MSSIPVSGHDGENPIPLFRNDAPLSLASVIALRKEEPASA